MYKNEIELDEFEYSNDGGNTLVTRTKDNSLQVMYDTSELKEGYYTSFLGILSKETLSYNQFLKVDITAHSDIDLNLNLIHSAKVNSKLLDGSFVFFQPVNHTETKILPINYGTFHLNEGDTGTIYFPLKNLETPSTWSIESIGLIFVANENEKVSVDLKNMEFVENDKFFNLELPSDLLKEVYAEIPTYGDYVYQYSFFMDETNPENSSVHYQMVQEEQGIHLSNDGVLTIHHEAKSGPVQIQVMKDNDFVYTYTVNLVYPWFANGENENLQVPKISEVANYADISSPLPIAIEKTIPLCAAFFLISYLCFYFARIRKHKECNK